MDINRILALPENRGCSRYGASSGRLPSLKGTPERLHLQRLRFVDQAYDVGGAYWGTPANVWCAFSPDTTTNEAPIRVFVRANSRAVAKQHVLDLLHAANGETGWRFFR